MASRRTFALEFKREAVRLPAPNTIARRVRQSGRKRYGNGCRHSRQVVRMHQLRPADAIDVFQRKPRAIHGFVVEITRAASTI